MKSQSYGPGAGDAPVDSSEWRRPVTDVAEWLRGLDPGVGQALHALGELLIGVGEHAETTETADEFAWRCLCVNDGGQLLDEQSALTAVSRLTTALVLAQWIEDHGSSCEIGSGEHTQPPSWTQTKVGRRTYRHPQCLQVHFPAGTIAAIGCVIGIETRDSVLRAPQISVSTLQRDQATAREILDRLTARAADFNLFRGRTVRATAVKGLNFTVIELPALATRDHVIVPEIVWSEISLAVMAVRDRHDLLNATGLGARRGVLLCGPPGTGKSAVSAVVANEVVGEFTVIYVEAKAGVQLLTAVVEEAQQLGGPILLVLEDVDLWCRDRATGPSAGLSELLGAMDIRPDSRILTLASTNDAATLDKAAIRTGRFDSVIEIGYPDRSASARILTGRLVEGPENTPGAAFVAALTTIWQPREHASSMQLAGRSFSLLPSRVLPASGEALDGYLERLADANALQTSQLLKMLRGSEEFPRKPPLFLLIEPGNSYVTRLAEITGATTAMLDATTLKRHDGGLPLWLDGFDPLDRHSVRQIVAQGWFPNTGSQICPRCLAHDHIWQLSWRLPIVTTCLIHKTFLTESCLGCGERFRLRRYSPLRPVIGPDEPCGNQTGLRTYCHHSALAHVAAPAPPDVVATASAVAGALNGRPNTIFSEPTSPQTYLAELRHLATLLLHLATTPRGACWSDWTEQLAAEAATRRTKLRGPRWGFSPPRSALARAKALSAARQIFEQETVERGAERLAPWLELIADTPGGPSNWIDNRTTRSPTMRRLVAATLADRRCAGRRIDYLKYANFISLQAIPQMIDVELYRNFFEGTLGSYEWTARLYASLCLARALQPGSTWAQAAHGIGLPSILGIRTARAASQRMRVAPDDLTHRVNEALAVLPTDRDFRHRERRVQWLADNTDLWFERWRMAVVPPPRATSLPYAITWLWCEVAQGWPASGPMSTTMAGPRRKDSYESFRKRLPRDAAETLRSIVI